MIPPQAITAGAGAATDILNSLNINQGNRKKAQAEAIANRANAQMAAIAAIAQARNSQQPAAAMPVQAQSNSMNWIIVGLMVAIIAVFFIIKSRSK